MPKQNVDTYLENFANWLYQAKHDPSFSGLLEDKNLKRKIEIDAESLSSELASFMDILISNPIHLEKLAKQCKKKLTELDNHLTGLLLEKDLPEEIEKIQENIASSLTQVSDLLKKIKEEKHGTGHIEQTAPPSIWQEKSKLFKCIKHLIKRHQRI